MLLSEKFWRNLFPHAHEDLIQPWIIDAHSVPPDILSESKQCAIYLGQIGHESGGMTIREENLNYRAARLMQVWPTRFPTLKTALPYEHNPKLLAEHVYGGRMGNGPEGSGDGWRYRGQGPIQITGKEDYLSVGTFCAMDLVHHPELASQPQCGPEIVAGYWRWKRIAEAVAKHDLDDAIVVSTRLINGGLIGLSDRREWIHRALKIYDAEAHSQDVLLAPEEVDVVVRNGSKGTAVEKLQRLLNARQGTSLIVDGKAGPTTVAAVIAFQEKAGLPDDGVVGSATWAALEAA